MTSKDFFPDLTALEPTRKTLHLYAHAVGVVPRAHAIKHPKWWHISLKVRPEGFVTDSMPLPGGGSFALRMDLRRHEVVLQDSRGQAKSFDMQAGLTGTDFGNQLIGALADWGLDGEYAREKFEDSEPREYAPAQAERLFTAMVNAANLFEQHRATLPGSMGPVQIWPHGFDLAFEWFGTRQVPNEEPGETKTLPAQLNLGFYPGEPEPYFYSNPWPFEKDALVGSPLPPGARWHTESWQGTYLPYARLAGNPHAGADLLAFAKAVYKISAPTLTA